MSNWTKVSENEEPEDDLVEAKNHGGLDDWFKKEKWVRVDVPKKKGKYQPCGRGSTSKGKKPVCVPVNKAKNLSDKERKNRVRQKRNMLLLIKIGNVKSVDNNSLRGLKWIM